LSLAVAAACFLALAQAAFAQVHVLTRQNDLARTGQNTNETQLTLASVNTNSFGLLFSYAVDGQVYAQPLYVTGLNIPGQGPRNVVFVATQHNSVYAFDADSADGPSGGLIWQTNLGPSATTPNADFGNRYGPFQDIHPEVGITSTPVIDLAAGTIYLDAFTHEGAGYYHRIHALNITNGNEQPYSPVPVRAAVAGRGAGSTNGVLAFKAVQHVQRSALTLAGGILYVAFAGYADTDPYHGWVVGFNSSNLEPLTNYVFNATPNSTIAAFGPNAGEGGIWMSGAGLSVDAAANLYFVTGNGSFNANTNGTEYGDSFVKLSTATHLAVADYFTPFNQAYLAANDADLGSGGALLLPDEVGSAAHPHLLVGCGKEGRIYLLDRDNLGHFSPVNDNQVVQSLPAALNGTWSSAAYFNQRVYYMAVGDVMKAFEFANGLIVPVPASFSAAAFDFPGATPAISANGTDDGIVWAVQTDGYNAGLPAILHAWPATNLAVELFNSSQAGNRDTLGPAVKYAVPTIANGKVYVGTSHEVDVLGNATFAAPPEISPAGGLFTNSAMVTITDAMPGASVYYTTDGSRPTTGSELYTGPFVLASTAVVTARAFNPGSVPSAAVNAVFINSASSQLTTGFLRQDYYSGQSRVSLESQAFSTPPTFTHYLTSFEDPSSADVNYTERVSGYFIPPQTGDYVFFVCADDDADLFLSTDATPAQKHLIATETAWSSSRSWTNSAGGSVQAARRSDQFAGTTWPGGNTITLTAGARYYIEGIHHQSWGGADFAATFKLSGQPDPVNGAAPRLTGALIAADAYDNTVLLITSAPQDAFTVPGKTAGFSVSATSAYLGAGPSVAGPPVSCQWQGAPAGSSDFTNIPNATGSAYSSGPLTPSQDGMRFRVALATTGARTNSPVATLNVGVGPAITGRPSNVSGGLFSSVALSVSAVGTAPLSYQWLKDGTGLAESLRINGARSATLTISNLQMNDAGSYSAVLTNWFGRTTNQPAVVLSVRDKSAPSLIITSHSNLQALAATRITLAGTASDAGRGDSGIAAVTVNGLPASNGTASGSEVANWSCSVSLVNGANIVRVVARDTASNAATNVIQIISDSTRPSVVITSSTASQPWSNSVFTVRGTARDNRAVAAVWCQSHGGWSLASTTNGWTNWTADVAVVPGTNVIRAYAADWVGNCSPTNQASVFFSITDPLLVQVTGQGSLAPDYNNRLLEIGKSYTITATPSAGYLFSNWIGSVLAEGVILTDAAKLNFLMQSNLVLQVNFVPNPFSRAAGTYQGLFYSSNGIADQSSGFVSAVVTSGGGFSAKLRQGNVSYPLSGQLSINGSLLTNAMTAGGRTMIWLQADLGTAERLSGGLSNANWTADLWANRGLYSQGNPSPQAGQYTLVIPGADSTTQPAGHGFGTVAVDASGSVTFTGTLGDGTKVTQTAMVSSQGQWPLYLPLYRGGGSMLGWLAFTNEPDRDIDGLLSWVKSPGRSTPLYRGGFTNEPEAAGSRYGLTNGAQALDVVNGTVILAKGNLPESITNQFFLGPNNLVIGSNKLSLKISTSSGLFQGTTISGSGKTIAISGALLQKQGAGFGQFIGADQSGSVSLEPR
jgi:hypothetical protein